MLRLHPISPLLAIVLSMSCSTGKPPTASRAVPAPAEYPVITRLVSRSQTITISAGPDCPLYSASIADGTRVFSDLTLDELRDAQPAAYQLVRPGIAAEVSAELSARE